MKNDKDKLISSQRKALKIIAEALDGLGKAVVMGSQNDIREKALEARGAIEKCKALKCWFLGVK